MNALERLVRRREQHTPITVGRLRAAGVVQQAVDGVRGGRIRVGGQWVLNFCSANYLGLERHPQVIRAVSRATARWGTCLGMPRLFATDRLTAALEKKIAQLVGQESALVFPSTTHVAIDLLPLLAGPDGVLFVDEWAYPISLEGARVAAERGARIRRFAHNDPRALARVLRAHARAPDKAIVCDGVYPGEGKLAILREITRLGSAYGAVVYVDDAHGVGVLGARPAPDWPYGRGGGGTPRYLGVRSGGIVHVGSLSKAFGVPLAFVAGPAGFVRYLGAVAPTFTHSSPPAVPVLAAALAVLRVHDRCGDALRWRLARNVRRFRGSLARAGVQLSSDHLLPIQTLRFATAHAAAEAAGRDLRRRGVWAVLQLHPDDHPAGGVLRFVLSARHEDVDIDEAVAAIGQHRDKDGRIAEMGYVLDSDVATRVPDVW